MLQDSTSALGGALARTVAGRICEKDIAAAYAREAVQ